MRIEKNISIFENICNLWEIKLGDQI